jgi:N-dimethylarginine dimethylaminohydrolase
MASNVPTRPDLPPAWSRRIADMQAEVRKKTFNLSAMPGYVRGEPPAIETWHNIDAKAIYPKIYGRDFGANGIGRLREVALIDITSHERFVAYDQDPAYFPQMGLSHNELDTQKMRDQSLAYEAALEAAGVIVHRVTYPDPPVGPFGPQRGTWAANELLVVRGGSIIEKIAVSPLGFGRSEYLAYWAWTRLGVPPVATITGKGVAEAGPCLWLAEDVFVAARGMAFNDAGLAQLIPVVERSCLADQMTTLVIECAGRMYFHPGSGVSHHPDMVIGPLDKRKVIAYLPGIDFRNWRWLKEHGFTVIEIDTDEQTLYGPANVTLIEPGRVMMIAEAPKAIAAVRKAGVDVTPVPYAEFMRTGGGLHCSTMRIWRDPGPFLDD